MDTKLTKDKIEWMMKKHRKNLRAGRNRAIFKMMLGLGALVLVLTAMVALNGMVQRI
tara:strand:- start:247 stop:417 length:171 start_codon:yes stop_codon:yes gene_type:complete